MLQALTAASDPTTPHYGQHWSVAQMNERVFAPALAHRRVVAWLTDRGAAELNSTLTVDGDLDGLLHPADLAKAPHTEPGCPAH